MARACLCDRWLNRAAGDMGFRALPLLARMLWFEILAASTLAPEKGVLRFPCSVSDAVSRLVNRTETDVETDLAALADLGWLDLDEDGRSVALPGVKAASARTEAARTNGLRGGRPRKGETRETARERRQGTLMLPMAGGAAETQETETEPRPESSRAAAKPIAIEKKEAADAREETDWVALGAELFVLAGLDPARGHHSALPVKGWLEAGAPPDLIREVVRTVAARPRRDGKPIGNLMYFGRAVMEALDTARARPEPAAPSDWDLYQAEVMRDWESNGRHGVPMSIDDWRATRRAVA
ncbi:hypothetical protein KPL78_19200 [Roseomonas sp. HJA6]|uniref:DUF1376 domain-containing protein n=1 Tax=Roseomonas alba TaxID=2846776 RepID=A0ABS7ACH2_9PROT|nr:hypothetical protein [Neoroseomonas alba]MBW6399996.1 hypothetical protein [Neoroseomonas alba]